MAKISDRLKEAMELRNLKQADLVEKTGISKGALSSYLSGRYSPKQNNIYLIAKALSVNEAWLMGADVPMERNKENDYLNNISANTIAFEITGRSLRYSPKIFDAICQSFDETLTTDNNIPYVRGEIRVNNLSDFLKHPDISFDEKADVINEFVEIILYDTKNEQLFLYYNLDNDSSDSPSEQLQRISHILNDVGLKKVVDYAMDLTNMSLYTKKQKNDDGIILLNAAHTRTDIAIPTDVDAAENDIMDADDF